MANAFPCPNCGYHFSVVDRTKSMPDLSELHRYRKCIKCGQPFKTEEKVSGSSRSGKKAKTKGLQQEPENGKMIDHEREQNHSRSFE